MENESSFSPNLPAFIVHYFYVPKPLQDEAANQVRLPTEQHLTAALNLLQQTKS